ncbi:MAG: potassium channel protein [Rubripirellula sp.]
MHQETNHRTDPAVLVAQLTTPFMFGISFVFLICQAALVVLWIDVPQFTESAKAFLLEQPPEFRAEAERLLTNTTIDRNLKNLAVGITLALWPLVIAESIFHLLTRSWKKEHRRFHYFTLLFCVCPSLRLCAPSPEMDHRIWLPGMGWRHPNKRLRRRLERRFSLPMFVIALMILPVLLVEYFLKAQVIAHPSLRIAIHVSTGIIWFAFAFEFIVLVAVARKKFAYCKTHWLDIVIILIPLFSFLRTLQVMRASQISKMARVYRLRGTAVRALRALILLEFFQRFAARDPAVRIDRMEKQLEEVELQAKILRRRIGFLRNHLREEELKAEKEKKPDRNSSRSPD